MNTIFDDIDRVNAAFFGKYEKATETEQESRTAAFDAMVSDEVTYLMENPLDIMDADVVDIAKIVENAKGDLLQLGTEVDKYFRKLAEEQAIESV